METQNQQTVKQDSQPTPEAAVVPEQKCKCAPVIIILAILTIGSLGFGGFEFWQNMKKDDEIASLEKEKTELEQKDIKQDIEPEEYQEEQDNPQTEQNEEGFADGDAPVSSYEIYVDFGGFRIKIPNSIVGFGYLQDTYREYFWGTVYHEGDQAVGAGIAWGEEKIESPFLAKIYSEYKSEGSKNCLDKKAIFVKNINENNIICYEETENLTNYYSESDMNTYIKPTLEILKQTFTNPDNYIKQ